MDARGVSTACWKMCEGFYQEMVEVVGGSNGKLTTLF